jgi:diguanylate cyclase (GGDEF)-like protein
MMDEQLEANRPPLNSLATKIILFVFLSTFATAVAVSWISIQSTHESLRGMIDHLYPLAVEHTALRSTPWLRAAELEVRSLALRVDPGAASHTLGETLDATVANSVFVSGVVLFSGDGTPRSRRGRLPDAADWREIASTLARGEPGLRAIALSDQTLALAVWSRWPKSGNRGGLLAFLDAEELTALLESELPDTASTLALVDGSGRVLAAAGANPITRVELSQMAKFGSDHTQGYDIGRKHMIGVSKPLGLFDWHAAIQAPFEAAFAPMLSVVTRIFLIDLVIILFFTSLAYRVTAKVIRPIEDLSDAARRIAQGQIDLEIEQPDSRDEIGLLARTFNDMMRRLRQNQDEIENANRHLTDRNTRLQQLNEVLNQLSITDGLTKLHNHRFFQDHLTREIKRVNRTREPLTMLLIDIDDFKQLNDRFGHASGDELLSRIARILNDAVREADLLARYGGEEFVILASNTEIDGAYQLAEKVRTQIAESSFILDDSLRPMRVTISIGVAQFMGNRKRFFHETDQALYQAKGAGKNCVIVHEKHTVKKGGAEG